MTVPTEIKRKEYSGSGSAGPFTITFPILSETHLSVSKVVVATGATTALTLNAGSNGYTVNSAKTEITLTEVLASGTKLVILRNMPLKQEVDYLANNAFPAETNEQALDYLTMIAQQLDEKIDRAVLLPETSSTTGIVIPEPEAGLFLAWNDAGTALENTEGIAGPQGPQGDPGTGDVNGPASSTEKQITLFDGSTGKLLEGATGTGFVKVVSGVYQTPAATIGTSEIANNSVTNALAADMAANTVKVRAAGTSGDPSDLAIAASQLVGRGSTGDVAAITLGTNLSMSGTTLNAAGGGFKTTTTASASANITFSSLDFANNTYEFYFNDIVNATDNTNFQILLSENNFSTSVDTVNQAYGYNSAAAALIGGETSLLKFMESGQTVTYNKLGGAAFIAQPVSGGALTGTFGVSAQGQTNPSMMQGVIRNLSLPATFFNAVRFQMSAGNLTSGSITMIRKPIT